jgi:hypothetical protein
VPAHGKPASKRHRVIDRNGIPLTVYLTAANVNERIDFDDVLHALEPIKRPSPGRLRCSPSKPHAGNDRSAGFHALERSCASGSGSRSAMVIGRRPIGNNVMMRP